MEIKDQFGDRIKQLRLRSGMSQDDVANIINKQYGREALSKSLLSRYENNIHKPICPPFVLLFGEKTLQKCLFFLHFPLDMFPLSGYNKLYHKGGRAKMKRNIMKRAHEIARTLIGDWYARLALALRQAWREAKEMTNSLIGSEKQIAWATEIRDGYAHTLEVLKSALSTVQDMSQVEKTTSAPWLGTSTTSLVYASSTSPEQQAAIARAGYWTPKGTDSLAPTTAWIVKREMELNTAGVEHAGRVASAESIAQAIKGLEKALETETSAKFWIDHK